MSNLNELENSNKIENESKTKAKTSKSDKQKESELKPKVNALKDSDKIKVMSLIPNVSYEDKKTGDLYKWEESEQVETMTYLTIQEMWRNYKSYFRNFWLKPLDDRVIEKLGLSKIYKDYNFIMDEASYTKENINSICEKYKNAPKQLKPSICNRVKDLVANGKIVNIGVVRTLEKKMNIDLIRLIED